MGFWGTGLYSGDFAMDLRKTVSAVAGLPFDAERLVEILCETEPTAADNPADEEHSTFWLIVADQFARRGLRSERVLDKAFAILDTGDDLDTLRRLGMKEADLRRRRRMLDELRERLTTPARVRDRAVLRKPQPLLMERGDAIVYPTCMGRCINPYYASRTLDVCYTKAGRVPWQQDGWGAAVIVDCGRAFDFLSWYRPLTLGHASREKPSTTTIREQNGWRLELPGTCSPIHFKRMELERIGGVPLDVGRIRATFGDLRPGISAAVSDISIANRLKAVPEGSSAPSSGSTRQRPDKIIDHLDEVLSE